MNQTLCSKGFAGSLKSFARAEFHLLVLAPPLQIAAALVAWKWGVLVGLVGLEILLQLSHELDYHRGNGPLLLRPLRTYIIGYLMAFAGMAMLGPIEPGTWWQPIVLVIAAFFGNIYYSQSWHSRQHGLKKYASWWWTAGGAALTLSGALVFRLWT